MQNCVNQSPTPPALPENNLHQLLEDVDLAELRSRGSASDGESQEIASSESRGTSTCGWSTADKSTDNLEPQEEHPRRLATLPPTRPGHQVPTRTTQKAAQALFGQEQAPPEAPPPAPPSQPSEIGRTQDLRSKITELQAPRTARKHKKIPKQRQDPSPPLPTSLGDAPASYGNASVAADAATSEDPGREQLPAATPEGRTTPWRLECSFDPPMPPSTDHSLIIVSLQLMLQFLREGASFSQYAWAPGSRGAIMHLELLPQDADLFKLFYLLY